MPFGVFYIHSQKFNIVAYLSRKIDRLQTLIVSKMAISSQLQRNQLGHPRHRKNTQLLKHESSEWIYSGSGAAMLASALNYK